MTMDNYRVYLRALEPEDYKTTINWRNDDEIWSMVGGPKYFVSSDYECRWLLEAINNKNQIRLGISLTESDELIGMISLINLDRINRSAECSYMIGVKKYWEKGYATEAMRLILDFAFNERNLKRISVKILDINLASIRMCEKCGYKKEGELRNSVYKTGKYHNQIIMSVLREEFDEVMNNI